MPIPVACPGCSARLNAPDQAAGKAVRCPKCQTPVPVPKPPADEGFEVVDDPPPVKKSGPVPVKPAAASAAGSGERPSTRRPARDEDDDAPDERPSKRRPPADDEDDRPSKRRPAAVDEDDEDRPARLKSRRPAEDEDDADDRPRRKEKPAGNSRKQRGLIAGAVGGVLFIGLIFSFMQMMSSVSDSIADQNQKGWADFQKQMNNQPRAVDPLPNFNVPPPNANNNAPPDKNPAPKPTNLPAGWEKFNDPLNEVTVYFPGPPTKNEETSARLSQNGGPADLWFKEAGDTQYTIIRSTLPATAKDKPQNLLFQAMLAFEKTLTGAKLKAFDLPVYDGPTRVSRVATYTLPGNKGMVIRGFIVGNRVMLATVTGKGALTAKTASVQPFLDNARFEK